ncbi:outer membrane beta-barrel protein [Elizabethkingia argentiflava]|uniref:Outer membrane beta-barrel protein n=1 Tax=Elizabethkingia argenteiflava TaxID=2681556 RepID=A0A845PVL6_9FLAO|nr:outer membrane beta-barrel protein [Elizabethkingia argenteiflava]NAW51864.1 outer membrane beta-barrel protein [Elizabethkingia argenteiflava]
MGASISIQAKSNPYFYSSLGVSKPVFQHQGSISLKINNPFQKYRMINTDVKNHEIIQLGQQKKIFRGFYLSFNHRFGKLKKEVKKNERSLQVDDTARETGTIN